ncbi:MAG: hypothetical protein ACRDRG_19265 [Pseudonocardiaceae bacterium]
MKRDGDVSAAVLGRVVVGVALGGRTGGEVAGAGAVGPADAHAVTARHETNTHETRPRNWPVWNTSPRYL